MNGKKIRQMIQTAFSPPLSFRSRITSPMIVNSANR